MISKRIFAVNLEDLGDWPSQPRLQEEVGVDKVATTEFGKGSPD